MTFSLDDAIALLGRTPEALAALLGGLPDAWTRGHEGPGTFSPHDVVGHLVHGEKTDWMVRARIILDHGESRPFDRYDRFAQSRDPADRTLPDLLGEFASLRRDNLGELRRWNLTAADLERSGAHPALGSVTLRQLLATWAVHDLTHLHQISRAMAHQYRDEVGPWNAYLGVLRCQGHGD